MYIFDIRSSNMHCFNRRYTYVFTADTYSFSKFFWALILQPIELSAILKNKGVLENRDERKLKLLS